MQATMDVLVSDGVQARETTMSAVVCGYPDEGHFVFVRVLRAAGSFGDRQGQPSEGSQCMELGWMQDAGLMRLCTGAF